VNSTDSYYQKQLFLAQVDKNDQIIGPVERWLAHKEGILHRGFTAILTFGDSVLLQHRKHIAFDDMWDLTFSSHQLFQDGQLEPDINAISNALEREWNVGKEDLNGEPVFQGKVYYQAKDPKSIFTEHEIDYVYSANLTKLPKPNLDFAYGFDLIKVNNGEIISELTKYALAPWVEEIVKNIDLKF